MLALTPSDFHFLNENVLGGGGGILFFWNQYSNIVLYEIVIYSINHKSYNKKVNIL